MTKEEQIAAISKIKEEFQLRHLRPLTMNRVINENGYLQICKYKEGPGLERVLCGTNGWNENALLRKWTGDDKSMVIYNITHDGNEARNRTEVGICLVEVVDANVLTKEQFDELYVICNTRSKRNDDLYERLKAAMLKEITRDKQSMLAWRSISFGFKDRIGLSIWQGDLQPTKIETGKTSQEITLEEIAKDTLNCIFNQ